MTSNNQWEPVVLRKPVAKPSLNKNNNQKTFEQSRLLNLEIHGTRKIYNYQYVASVISERQKKSWTQADFAKNLVGFSEQDVREFEKANNPSTKVNYNPDFVEKVSKVIPVKFSGLKYIIENVYKN